MLVSALRALDRMLRGDVTRLAALKTGRLDLPLRQIGPLLLLLAALYGAAMGLFATVHQGHPQVVVNLVKLPALFLLTLLVTFPSLCVFNILVGSRLSAQTLLNMLLVSLGVMIVVLASLAPILVFFTLSTRSHSFMVLLNIVNFLIAAAWGRSFLVQTLHGLLLAEESIPSDTATTPAAAPEATPPTELQFDDTPVPQSTEAPHSPVSEPPTGPVGSSESAGAQPAAATPPPTPSPTTSPSRAKPPAATPASRAAVQRPTPAASRWRPTLEEAAPVAKVKSVLRTWLWIFVGVGLQMTWILGPLVGNPWGAFVWFHPPGKGNFVQGFLSVLFNLFG